jgi:enamine deaminase RidA (YjgF/YER057c/UK114 family)
MTALGASMAAVAHLTVYVDDIDAFARALPMFEKAFGRRRPALYAVEVPRVAPLDGARVAATAIAWLGKDAPVPISA